MDRESILARWSANPKTTLKNWGDALNPLLIGRITGRRVVNMMNAFNFAKRPVYSVIGSVLDDSEESELIVWGSGFISESGSFRRKPRAIVAVRGPRTRQIILRSGMSCPEVFGDPALLFPAVYRPSATPVFDLGILPHYADRMNSDIQRLGRSEGVRFVDVLASPQAFVDQLSQCRVVASSSLHGLIAADSYGIPSIWIRAGMNIIGGDFKFRDYWEGVGVKPREAFVLSRSTSVLDLVGAASLAEAQFDQIAFLDVCPLPVRCNGDLLHALSEAS